MSGDLNNWQAGDVISSSFVVQRRLGSGFEAVVYLVRDARDRRLRTLKLFKRTNALAEVKHTFRHWQRYAGLDSVKQCLEMGMLRGQRRVSERPWLLMEYVPGMTLAEKMKRGEVRNSTALTIRLLRAMAHVHGRGAGLGDLDKGRNVVYERGSGRTVFIDLDAGTPGHAPPEIYEDLLEVLWLARKCAARLPPDLVRVLTTARDAPTALQTLEGRLR